MAVGSLVCYQASRQHIAERCSLFFSFSCLKWTARWLHQTYTVQDELQAMGMPNQTQVWSQKDEA